MQDKPIPPASSLESFDSIKTVIFDLDGVLIDSSDGIIDATNYVLRNINCPERSPDEIKIHIGRPLPKMFADFSPGVDYERIRPLFKERAKEVIVQTTELLPYVVETLVRLKSAGYRMAIGSTKVRAHIVGVVEKFSLEEYFEALVGGDEAEPKPSPDIFLLALDRLGAAKESTMIIGDTISDVLAAEAAGIPIVTVASDFGKPGELDSYPLLRQLNNLREVAEFLCEANTRKSQGLA